VREAVTVNSFICFDVSSMAERGTGREEARQRQEEGKRGRERQGREIQGARFAFRV